MKKPFLFLGLCAVFMLTLFVSADTQTKPAGANFAGTWVLDKTKSELPQMMQNIDGVTWVITQDDKELTREQQFEGGPGGARGMIGNVALTVKLDGSETSTDAPRISGKRTAKANWQDDGKILEVSAVTTGSFNGNEIKATTTEHWELAEGGKVLKVHQKVEGTRGSFELKMVFNKK
jgi:hypothetical protein